MKHFLKIYIMTAIMMVFLPFPVFAQVDNKTCSPKGYTVETINGVFTNEKEARDNKIALEKISTTFLQQPTPNR